MPIRNNPLPTDPSTGSLPPAYEAVDLGNPHLAHGGAPAESPEHRGVGGRLLGWLGGTDDDAGAYRSYSYFPHHGSLEGGLPAHHAGAAGAPTAVATVRIDDEIPWNTQPHALQAAPEPVDAIPLANFEPAAPLPSPSNTLRSRTADRASYVSSFGGAGNTGTLGSNAQYRISEDAALARTLQSQEYALANSSAAPPPGYTRPGTYNRDDAATTGVQTIRFPRNAQVASALGVTAVNAGRPGAVVSDKPVEEKKLKKHKPWFIWTVSLIQVATLVASIFINKNMTGEYIQTTPVWNYMIGPTSGTLIRMGARFTPCIRVISTYTTNATSPYLPACPLGVNPPCNIQDVCGLDGTTDQWYRFLMAIFLHAGVVHLAFNLLFQLRVGAAMERDFGSFRIAAIYMISGVAGFAFGANINAMLPSVGCSGALFGLVACLLLDLLQNWKLIVRPWFELFKLLLVILLTFGIGLLPYIDNFAHIGGFVVGIFAGLIFLPTLSFGKWERRRKWILIAIAVPLLAASYFALFWVFYNGIDRSCEACRYIDCLPVFGQMCAVGG